MPVFGRDGGIVNDSNRGITVEQAHSTPEIADAVHQGVQRMASNIRSVIYIDPQKLEHIIAALIAGGHVILADSHGVGKTSLARALADSIEWRDRDLQSTGEVDVDPFSRIQCTVDMLPQDILGYNRFLSSSDEMVFNRGPIFSHFVLTDEINLLTPKAQGSFLEAMQEQAVTIEGTTYRLPDPFFIIATMNLKGAHLFPLPAPQLDRFMVQLSLGYPHAEAEGDIIKMHSRKDAWSNFSQVVGSREILGWQSAVDKVTMQQEVVDYVVATVRATRSYDEVDTGASPRTGVELSRFARALALVRGQDYVSIDLVKEVYRPVVSHRVIMKDPGQSNDGVLDEILDTVPVDGQRSSRRQRAGAGGPA
jgi:MoxR-like ATPase